MTAKLLFTAIVGLVGIERLIELAVSRRNAAWSFAHGGQEHGHGHYRAMVLLHTGLLGGALAEVWLLDRPFVPLLAALSVLGVVLAQGLRWWCIATLGRQWNTRVIVVPGAARVRGGPYRWLDHPNYVAVAAEGIALPLVHGAFITAIAFTALNLLLMRTRIRCEEEALAALAEAAERSDAAAAAAAAARARKRVASPLDETGEAEVPPAHQPEPPRERERAGSRGRGGAP